MVDSPAGLGDRAWAQALRVAPLKTYTRVVGAMAGIRVPRALRPWVYGGLAAGFGMELREAELDLTDYPSFADLFVRRLRPGARDPDPSPETIVSPVDGCVSQVGPIDGGTLIQAKGLTYTAAELLDDDALATQFEGGTFATLYLRPKDYHRIHAPVSLDLQAAWRIPGELLPVQPSVVRTVRGLFVRNERLVISATLPDGAPFALVAVGATAVGAITSPFIDVDTPRRDLAGTRLEKGDELAAFNLGSTVILLCSQAAGALHLLAPAEELRVGRPIGQLEERA